jgi:proteasome lid subunit RPN8/RPN11
MIRLPDALVGAIRRAGEAAYPAECCGVIAGRVAPDKEAVRLVPMANRRTDDPHRYLIDPEDWRRVDGELRAEGWEILGYYHSHPDHPAVPSAFDAAQAWPWYSYIIVEVWAGRAGEPASWVLDGTTRVFARESLVVLNEVEA